MPGMRALTIAILAAALAAAAQQSPDTRNPTPETRPGGRVELPVIYYRLPNGLKVVISEQHTAPAVTVAVYYGVGFRIEPKGRTGFAHLFEHMMFEGSEHV